MSEHVRMKAGQRISYFKTPLADNFVTGSCIINIVNLVCFCNPFRKTETNDKAYQDKISFLPLKATFRVKGKY